MRRSSTRRSRRSMSSSRRRFLSESLILLALWGPACATRTAGPTGPPTPPPSPAHELARSLDTLFATPPADRVVWGVSVRVPGGESLYQRNASLLLHPASNMKLVTLAAAAERLGWDFRFETTIRTTTSVAADGTRQRRSRGDWRRRPDDLQATATAARRWRTWQISCGSKACGASKAASSATGRHLAARRTAKAGSGTTWPSAMRRP